MSLELEYTPCRDSSCIYERKERCSLRVLDRRGEPRSNAEKTVEGVIVRINPAGCDFECIGVELGSVTSRNIIIVGYSFSDYFYP